MKKIAVVPRLPQPVLEQIAKLGEVLVPQSGAPLDKAGMQALMRVSGVADKPELQAEDVAFAIAPRLNAAGPE